MPKRELKRVGSSSSLLKRLTDHPALPAFVPTLPQQQLQRLVRYVGIEDAAVLLEHTTAEQLSALVDDEAWKVVVPGQPEVFDPPEFLRWLDALMEVSDEFCAERSVAMGEDMLAFALAHFVETVDLGLKVLDDHELFEPGASAESVELYGVYQVAARHDDEWDVVRRWLDVLHLHEADLLQFLLGRCFPRASTIEKDSVAASHDATAAHMRRREESGYVTPEGARAFLNHAASESLDSLAQEAGYDLETERYLRLVTHAAASPAGAASRAQGDPARPDAAAETGASADALRELEDLVVAAVADPGVDGPVALLGDASDGPQPELLLEQRLQAAAAQDPERSHTLMAEAAYLSNVLMTGQSLAGERFTEQDSLPAVLATCNLGLDYLNEETLDHPAGLVRLFRIGWNLLATLPLQCAQALREQLGSVDASASPRAWMFAEALDDLLAPAFLDAVAARRFDESQQTLHMLSLVMQEEAFYSLEALIADMPRIFTHCDRDDVKVVKHHRFVSSLDDLDKIDTAIASVVPALKLT